MASIEELNELDDILAPKNQNADEVSSDEGQHGTDGKTEVTSRGERKARKALAKLGLQKIPGINRVVMRRPKGVLLVISQPEVFKSPDSNCYIVFGEAKIEDSNGFLGQQNPFMQAQNAAKNAPARPVESKKKSTGKTAAIDISKFDENDESGLDAKEIDLVIDQANCSRGKAVQALRASNGDIINAIMAASES